MDNSGNVSGREIDLLELKDTRFRLPGNVGICINDTWAKKFEKFSKVVPPVQPCTKHTKKLTKEELLKNLKEDKPMPNTNVFLADERSILDCDAHECPALLLKDFQELFPRHTVNLTNGLTVLTITQKTHLDMALWSSEVITEREELMGKFIYTAQQMCSYLKENGYWADFIDPSSGGAHYGEYTPATFFETDERYRKFGFEIEDLGCCKVISHSKWGTNAFVGALFTNAPIDSDAVERLLIHMDD